MKTLLVTKENSVLTVQLNRAEVHNAFDPVMIQELTTVFREDATAKDVRVVVLKGAGKSFCAGADLGWMKSMARYTEAQNREDSEKLFDMFFAIASVPVPVIGKVQGSVFGGGVGLTAVCDIVGAVKDSKFCFSETKLGLVPAVISTFVLRKTIGGQSRPYMITAQVFDEERAQAMGLVHFCGAPEEVDDFVQSQIDFCLSSGPEAVSATKGLLNSIESIDWKYIKSLVCQVIAERRVSPEGQEGLSAFFEKRKPNWKL